MTEQPAKIQTIALRMLWDERLMYLPRIRSGLESDLLGLEHHSVIKFPGLALPRE